MKRLLLELLETGWDITLQANPNRAESFCIEGYHPAEQITVVGRADTFTDAVNDFYKKASEKTPSWYIQNLKDEKAEQDANPRYDHCGQALAA